MLLLTGLERAKNNQTTSTTLNSEYLLEMVRKHGEDSLAYLTLEQGKKYFTSEIHDGFIAYVLVGKIVVCLGNPVCTKDSLEGLLTEFKEFCQENKLKICFCSVSGEIVKILKRDGYRISKYGEEAVLDLDFYKTVGSSTAKLRQKLRRAEKSGIITVEYQPQKCRDSALERKIIGVSEEWYADKNGKLTFTLGEINLDNPLDRRYFTAVDGNEEVQVILVFSPFCRGKGYFLDVMRRKSNSIPGAMEKAIIDSALRMKDEGVKWLSLGIAPLAGLDKQNQLNLLEKCLKFTYNHMNQHYGFKTLYDYKRKFSPSRWEPRYVVHEPGISCFEVGLAMLKARSVDGFWQQLLLGIIKAGKTTIKTRMQQMFSRCTNNVYPKANYENRALPPTVNYDQ